MNKNIIIYILIIVIIIVLITLALLFLKNNNSISINNQNETSTFSIEINDKPISYHAEGYDVEMIIPEFINLTPSFNSYINNKISSELSYTNIYNDLTSGIVNKDQIGDFIYNVKYDKYDNDDYITIIASQEIELVGIRNKSLKKIYMIDAKQNRLLSLKDIMDNNLDYKKEIVSQIEDLASKKSIELIGGNGLGTIDDDQKFYIKNKKLHIYFESGEVAPVAVGELDFEMPFTFEDGFFKF